jgi:hypothetical protein
LEEILSPYSFLAVGAFFCVIVASNACEHSLVSFVRLNGLVGSLLSAI